MMHFAESDLSHGQHIICQIECFCFDVFNVLMRILYVFSRLDQVCPFDSGFDKQQEHHPAARAHEQDRRQLAQTLQTRGGERTHTHAAFAFILEFAAQGYRKLHLTEDKLVIESQTHTHTGHCCNEIGFWRAEVYSGMLSGWNDRS